MFTVYTPQYRHNIVFYDLRLQETTQTFDMPGQSKGKRRRRDNDVIDMRYVVTTVIKHTGVKTTEIIDNCSQKIPANCLLKFL